MTTIPGTTFLITGAGGGFGSEMVRQLLSAGARLVLTDRDGDVLRSTADGILAELGPAVSGEVLACLTADLSSREGCEGLHEDAAGFDVGVLVNNAGLGQAGYFHEIPRDEWELLMKVNLLAPMHLCRLLVPGFLERGAGHIVNISSIAGWIGAEGLASYNASKFGLRGFSDALRAELEPQGIRVTAIYPFFSNTPILDSPRYGSLPETGDPREIATDPADIVRVMIDGIRRGQDHVFTERQGRTIRRLQRWAPWLLKIMTERMRKKGVSP